MPKINQYPAAEIVKSTDLLPVSTSDGVKNITVEKLISNVPYPNPIFKKEKLMTNIGLVPVMVGSGGVLKAEDTRTIAITPPEGYELFSFHTSLTSVSDMLPNIPLKVEEEVESTIGDDGEKTEVLKIRYVILVNNDATQITLPSTVISFIYVKKGLIEE